MNELRASDADRERVSAGLGEHLAAGRLTLEEFSERVGAAQAARTHGELERLTRDLPGPAHADRSPSPVHRTISVLGSSERKGRWRVPRRTQALALLGSCELDLRGAELAGDEVVIDAWALLGSVEIVVPEGVEVEVTGLALLGSKEERVSGRRLPHAPVIRVRAFAVLGSVEIRSRPVKGLTQQGT